MRIAACILAGAACAGQALAEPTVTREVKTYEVRGDTPAKLRTDINAKRPPGPNGRRFDAYTTWYVRWEFSYAPRGGRCAITQAETWAHVEITMPKLARKGAPAEVAKGFEAYLKRLLEHEEGHAGNGVDVARKIERAILATPPAKTCAATSAAASARAEDLLAKAQARDVEYDRETKHGATQGARYP